MSTTILSPPAPADKAACPTCHGKRRYRNPQYGNHLVCCGECSADPFDVELLPHFACKQCGDEFHADEVHRGRGRHLGQHPEHDYAPCGHSLTWFGRKLTPAGIRHRLSAGVAKLDRAELVLLAEGRYHSATLPIPVRAPFGWLTAAATLRSATEWLLWLASERLKGMDDDFDREVEAANDEQCRYGDALPLEYGFTAEGLRWAA